MMTATPGYAALLGMIFVILSLRTIRLRLRRRHRVAVGDGDNAELRRAMRVHANFAPTSRNMPRLRCCCFIWLSMTAPKCSWCMRWDARCSPAACSMPEVSARIAKTSATGSAA
jgi:hypothetical protein